MGFASGQRVLVDYPGKRRGQETRNSTVMARKKSQIILFLKKTVYKRPNGKPDKELNDDGQKKCLFWTC